MTFIHTADWHLGHTYWKIGARAAQSHQWRFEAIRRIWQLAAEKNADFVVVAGDVFDTDTPSESVRRRTVELLADAPAPVFLISGNHDPAAEGSVWFHPDFAREAAALPNVHLTLENQPVEAPGDVLLFPCPVTKKYSRADATQWIPVGQRGERYRVGLAHGGWRGYFGGEDQVLNCISSDCAARAGLDYLALGDYHSFTPADHAAAKARSFYAGTPEITAKDNGRAGHALVVEIENPGAELSVTPEKVGRIHLHDAGKISIANSSDWDGFLSSLASDENREETILRAKFSGDITPTLLGAMNDWARAARENWFGADLDFERVRALPTRDDFAALKLEKLEETVLNALDGPLNSDHFLGHRDAQRLSDWSGDEDARREALSLYFRLLGG